MVLYAKSYVMRFFDNLPCYTFNAVWKCNFKLFFNYKFSLWPKEINYTIFFYESNRPRFRITPEGVELKINESDKYIL